MNNQFFLWFVFVAAWPWRKKLSLTELLPSSLIWFGTSCVSGTIIACSFCCSLLLVSSCLCLYGLILPKTGHFFLLFTFEAWASVGHSFLSFLLGLFAEDLFQLCWLLLVLRERLSLFFFFLCWLCRFLPFQSLLEVLLSWDFFPCLKLCVALRKPEEALFRYHSFFPWNTFIDFSSSF